jgi:hypothetical protein
MPVQPVPTRLTRAFILALSVVSSMSFAACETSDDPCAAAKGHLCEKLDAMGCNTALMDNAVNRIVTECGADEGERFVGAAAAWCQTTSDYTSAGCEAR